MKHLRCIGGPRHGSVIALSDHQNDVQLVNDNQSFRRRSCAAEEALEISKAPKLHYTARRLHTPDGNISYLALAEMSDIEALRIALGPMR